MFPLFAAIAMFLLAQNVVLVDQILAALGKTAPKQAAVAAQLNGLWRKLGATGCTNLA